MKDRQPKRWHPGIKSRKENLILEEICMLEKTFSMERSQPEIKMEKTRNGGNEREI